MSEIRTHNSRAEADVLTSRPPFCGLTNNRAIHFFFFLLVGCIDSKMFSIVIYYIVIVERMLLIPEHVKQQQQNYSKSLSFFIGHTRFEILQRRNFAGLRTINQSDASDGFVYTHIFLHQTVW